MKITHKIKYRLTLHALFVGIHQFRLKWVPMTRPVAQTANQNVSCIGLREISLVQLISWSTFLVPLCHSDCEISGQDLWYGSGVVERYVVGATRTTNWTSTARKA